VELPDGDFVDLDWVEASDAWTSAGALVLVLHGLEGSARSGYAMELYRQLARVGLPAVGLNFRSCSGDLNRAPRLYHSGETGDLAYVVDLLARRLEGGLLGAAGFSLGGNVLLKYLAESACRSSSPAADPHQASARLGRPIVAAAAVSVPFNLSAGADALERGFAPLYRRYLVTKLKRKVAGKTRVLAPRIEVARALRARTFREFDDAATAPLHGFRDAEDYYRRSSSGPMIERIDVPTLLVHALNDPFLPASAVPLEAARRNPAVTPLFTERGGHVGFVAGHPWSPVFWAERQVAAFLASHLLAASRERTASSVAGPKAADP
jgi:predicted alpha/beta-fold hydrolase